MKGKQASETQISEHLRSFFGSRLAEKATPEYFEEMLGQVHRRLRQELVGRPYWWDRLAELLAPSFSGLRPLLVRYALPLILFGSIGGFVLQQERLAPKGVSGALQAGGAPSLLASAPLTPSSRTNLDSLSNLRGAMEPSFVRPTAVSGVGEEKTTTKAKDRENGGRSFVNVLPVRYEASVDF
ncbi:MAG: hypothetical protein AB7T14_06725 [Candidatus Methylacidiphilaceae bacterium]